MNSKRVASVENTQIEVWITDARIAVACSTYNVAHVRSAWLPPQDLQDVVDDVIDNVVGKAVESVFNRIERHGKMLVAQFRYPWLRAVGSTSRSRGEPAEMVMLEARVNEEANWRLEIAFPDSTNAAEIAANVTRRAARFRLAVEEHIAPEEDAALLNLASAVPFASEAKGGVAYHVFPRPWDVTEASAALLGLPADAASQIEASLETRAPSSDEVLRAIKLVRQVETGEVGEDLGPLFGALAATRASDLDELAPTIAWFAGVLAQKVPRERREAAARTVMPRLREIIQEQHLDDLHLDQPAEQGLARLIRVWFVTAPTIDERIEFLLRYWDEPLADEHRGIYVIALVVGAALVSTCLEGGLKNKFVSEVSRA